MSEKKKAETRDRKIVTKQRLTGEDCSRSEARLSDETSSQSDANSEEDNTTNKTEQIDKLKPNSSLQCSLYVFICCVIAVAVTYYIFTSNEQKNNTLELPTLTDHLYSLDKDFPQQPSSLWTTIVSGIKDFYTRKPQQPCIILLFGEVDSKETAECLVHEVANQVIGDMHNNNVKPAFLEAANIQSNDYGEVLQDLRSIVSSQKVLIIKNLQDMEGSMAQSLHSLCDRYNPAVREALIFFTLHGRPSSGNAAAMAQQLLNNKWKTQVPADKLPALITRITSRVIAVLPESNLPAKCVTFVKKVNSKEL